MHGLPSTAGNPELLLIVPFYPGLYWGFLPHCFEAWPHDISELLLYGFLKDRIVNLGTNPLPSSSWLSGVPLGVWDMANGAVSGGFAAVVSMPFDCVKTYMQVGAHTRCSILPPLLNFTLVGLYCLFYQQCLLQGGLHVCSNTTGHVTLTERSFTGKAYPYLEGLEGGGQIGSPASNLVNFICQHL